MEAWGRRVPTRKHQYGHYRLQAMAKCWSQQRTAVCYDPVGVHSRQGEFKLNGKEHHSRAFKLVVWQPTQNSPETAIFSSTTTLQTTFVALLGSTAAAAYSTVVSTVVVCSNYSTCTYHNHTISKTEGSCIEQLVEYNFWKRVQPWPDLPIDSEGHDHSTADTLSSSAPIIAGGSKNISAIEQHDEHQFLRYSSVQQQLQW